MSSGLSTFDISVHRHSSQDMVSYDGRGDLTFFSDSYPFPFLTDSPIDVAQENLNNSLDPFSSSFLSFSPPCTMYQENHNLYEANPVQPQSNGSNIKNELGNFSASDGSEVKSEESQIGMDYNNYNHQLLPHSWSGAESASKLMQRSYSCKSFDGKPDFPFEAQHDTLMESPNFQWHALSSPENSFFTREMRKVCSAGDLQNMKATHESQTESHSLVEANFKVGRCSAEDRKEKISRYRAKRSQRKFNKIIKYACRKTLADNRTRIRGRFARNDEISEIAKAPCLSTTEEYEDELWGSMSSSSVRNAHGYGAPQFQYRTFGV